MFTTDNFQELAKATKRVCLAIGVFDGVHRGHQKVIGQAVEDAKACDGDAVVLTFDPHPMRVLQPDLAPRLLTSTAHKLRLIEPLGVQACMILKFDQQLANTPPQEFIEMIIRNVPDLREICVGHQWRFGKDRKGSVPLIEEMGKRHGFSVREIPRVTVDGETVSSTLLRRVVADGELSRAERLLGRPFSILGTVDVGDRRGRELGFPTANLNPHNEILPPSGVYAVRASVLDAAGGATPLLDGVLNIGFRPTITSRPQRRTVELHLFGLSQDLYQRQIEVFFCCKIRDEQKFESLDALKRQIAADVQTARQLLGR